MNQPLKVAFKTLGCKVNLYDTHAMQGSLGPDQTAVPEDEAEVLVVNSCAVTHEAWREARQAIRRFKRLQPEGRVVLTGCYAQIQPEESGALPEVDWVLGTRERSRLPEVLASLQTGKPVNPHLEVGDVMADRVHEPLTIPKSYGRTRGTLRVQTGCNYRCSFCVIPLARGNSVSVPLGEVLDEARRLIDAGHQELCPVGIHVADYGKDLKPRDSFLALVDGLLALPGLGRLRLSSIDPHEVDEALLERVAHHPKMAPHLHVAVQSMSDAVLKAMKRRHDAASFAWAMNRLREMNPKVGVGTDVISGFPTETEEDHQETMSRLKDLGLSYLHVFPYSTRPGTAASALKPLHGQVVKDRSKALRDLGQTLKENFAERLVGAEVKVLVEAWKKSPGSPTVGWTGEYVRAYLTGTGKGLHRARVDRAEAGEVFATLLP